MTENNRIAAGGCSNELLHMLLIIGLYVLLPLFIRGYIYGDVKQRLSRAFEPARPLVDVVKPLIRSATDRLRYNWLADTMYLKYHEGINWIGRNKKKLLIVYICLHLAINHMTKDEIKVFVPVRLSDGSSSHYYRFDPALYDVLTEPKIEDAVEEISIASPPGTSEEMVRVAVGDRLVWCRDCRQWHCCELAY